MAFKRDFLNTKKGRAALGINHVPNSYPEPSEPVPEPAQNHVEDPPSEGHSSDECRSTDGTEPEETVIPLDLHSTPNEHLIKNNQDSKKRYVFREWPRDPDGQMIGTHKDPPYGKRTSNGCPTWGETLWDFYLVMHDFGAGTLTSGSRLAACMHHFGELDAAADELEWADLEGEPEQVFPCDIGQLIRDRERSPFFLAPRVPVLQARLPFHLLPEKLIVHDPWNTLSVTDVHTADASSPAKDDIVHVFELSLSEEGKKKQLAEREAAKAVDEAYMEEIRWRYIVPSVEQPGPLPPGQFAWKVEIPPRPPRPSSIPEAHLYIRREDKCGSGHHSVVYFSELELPRWALVDDELCETCLLAAVRKEIDERQKAGTFYPENPDGEEELAEIKRESTTIVDRSNDTGLVTQPHGLAQGQYTIRIIPHTVSMDEYSGLAIHLYPDVTWQNPEYGPMCEHLRIDGRDPPLTARVKVCAKLSIQGDLHLAHEAENYQAFPSYFFEHWNGYNIVQPLRDPTPCGALVPQFYGYYVPQGGFEPVVNSAPEKDTSEPYLPDGYISPLLLLEHCGVPVQLENMGEDDRNACAALCFLFDRSGWAHGSVAERNVVVQDGPLSEWPAFRSLDKRQRSFRLIDFGRAERWSEKDDPSPKR